MSLILETTRLELHAPKLTDLENLCLLQTDPAVMKYIGHGMPRTKPQIVDGLQAALHHQDKHGFSLGSVIEKKSRQYVGRAGLIYLGYDDTQPHIEIGYALLKQHWGQGFATELAGAMIKWGFVNLQIEKLLGIINPANLASRHVLEKVGMHYVCRDKYHHINVDRLEITRMQYEN